MPPARSPGHEWLIPRATGRCVMRPSACAPRGRRPETVMAKIGSRFEGRPRPAADRRKASPRPTESRRLVGSLRFLRPGKLIPAAWERNHALRVAYRTRFGVPVDLPFRYVNAMNNAVATWAEALRKGRRGWVLERGKWGADRRSRPSRMCWRRPADRRPASRWRRPRISGSFRRNGSRRHGDDPCHRYPVPGFEVIGHLASDLRWRRAVAVRPPRAMRRPALRSARPDSPDRGRVRAAGRRAGPRTG